MADYRIESRLRDGTYIAALPWQNLQYELGWNKTYSLRFELPLYHPAVTWDTLHPGLHEIWCWRNNSLVKAGPLWDATPSSDNSSIGCSASDLMDYFDIRLIDTVDYAAVDQTTIAWDLIDDSQSKAGGDLSIVQGTLDTGVTRSASWKSFDNKMILDALTDFQEMNFGFDFTIAPATRAFSARYPRPQRDNHLRLEYPVSIRRYSVQYMGKYLRNSIRVTATDPTYVTAVDTTSRNTYGLREMADSYRDAATVTDLTDYTSKIRDRRKDVKNYPTVLVDPDIINVFDSNVLQYGDLVQVVISDGYVNIDEQLRYITAQISVDKQGSETVVIYLQDTRELN
jgi:hypothetical protein